jgi:hypothetical protein
MPHQVDPMQGADAALSGLPYANADEEMESQSPPKRLGRAKWGRVWREMTYDMTASFSFRCAHVPPYGIGRNSQGPSLPLPASPCLAILQYNTAL